MVPHVRSVPLLVRLDGAADLLVLLAASVQLLDQIIELLVRVVELAFPRHHLALRRFHSLRRGFSLRFPSHNLHGEFLRVRV